MRLLFAIAITVMFSAKAYAHGDEKHSEPAANSAEAIATNTAEIIITDGWLSSGPEAIKVKRGDQVRLLFTSNQADELHLHGYDITLQLKAKQPAALTFEAIYPGRFSYELHKAHREIGAIEVYP